MKILILTGSEKGTAAHHLPYLNESDECDIVAVILNRGNLSDWKKYYKRKLKKLMKIGLWGTLNGIRMRKWYQQDMRNYLSINNIKDQCEADDIPLYETSVINCEHTQRLFAEADADLGLSLGNGYITEKIFSIPTYGMLNIHHEILPDYQNAQSVIWQIYNHSKCTGYTIHKIEKKIDAGNILKKEKIHIRFKDTLADTVANTMALLMDKSAVGMVDVIKNFTKYYSEASPQGKGNSYTTPTFREYLKIKRNFKLLKNESRQ